MEPRVLTIPLLRLLGPSWGVRRIGSRELSLEDAECRLRCNFCSHGIAKGRGAWPGTPGLLRRGPLMGLRRRIVREWVCQRFGEELRGVPVSEDPVALGGWDPLEHDEVARLVQLAGGAGRALRIISPGLRLADRAFARELSPMAPEFVLTYLSVKPMSYALMTGLPGAKDLVERALENLLGEGLRVAVNVVVTSENCHELSAIVDALFGDLGLLAVTVMAVLPDKSHLELDPRFGEKLPDLRMLGEEVAKSVARHGPRGRRLTLWNIPPCKMPGRTLASGHLSFSPMIRDTEHPIGEAKECRACGYRPRCSMVSPAYLERSPEERFDPGVVAPFLEHLLAGRVSS